MIDVDIYYKLNARQLNTLRMFLQTLIKFLRCQKLLEFLWVSLSIITGFYQFFRKMFVIKIVDSFAAAHSLRDYSGDCMRLHGHNWQVEVLIKSKELNKTGMVIDFRVAKNITKTIIKKLDHQYLNDVPPFDNINPTAENIAKYFFDELNQSITNNTVKVKEVIIWETSKACASYSEAQL